MILVIILYGLLASTFTFGKAALVYLQPLLFVAVRMLIGGIVLVGYHGFIKSGSLRIHKQHRLLFAGMCLFHIYGAYIFEYWALQYVSSFKACLLYNLTPFITALLASYWAHEVITPRKWAGLLLGFIGVLPVLIESNQLELRSGTFIAYLSYAELALIGSVICAALGWLFMHRLVRNEGYSPVMVNGISMLVGGWLAFVTSLFVEGTPHILVQTPESAQWFSSNFAACAFYVSALVLIGNVICYNLYGVLLKRYSATFLSLAGLMTPLFAALIGNLVLSEVPSLWFFISVVCVGLGLAVFYYDELIYKKEVWPS